MAKRSGRRAKARTKPAKRKRRRSAAPPSVAPPHPVGWLGSGVAAGDPGGSPPPARDPAQDEDREDLPP
jgi:hypothetical protein